MLTNYMIYKCDRCFAPTVPGKHFVTSLRTRWLRVSVGVVFLLKVRARRAFGRGGASRRLRGGVSGWGHHFRFWTQSFRNLKQIISSTRVCSFGFMCNPILSVWEYSLKSRVNLKRLLFTIAPGRWVGSSGRTSNLTL